MLTDQETAQIRNQIRRSGYGITLEAMKRFFIQHEKARRSGDTRMMERIEYHLTYLNFHYECGLLMEGRYDNLTDVIENW